MIQTLTAVCKGIAAAADAAAVTRIDSTGRHNGVSRDEVLRPGHDDLELTNLDRHLETFPSFVLRSLELSVLTKAHASNSSYISEPGPLPPTRRFFGKSSCHRHGDIFVLENGAFKYPSAATHSADLAAQPYKTSELHSPPFHYSPRPAEKDQDPERHPNLQRDAQEDRTQINPDSNEYSKSGTDDTAAGNDEAAFDPNITDPQAAK